MGSSSDYFHFKKFRVKNTCSAMKVNTDGVLLGAWMTIKADDRLFLDIGTGSGVIALMVAQRADDSILVESVEIDPGSANEARFNFENSPWSDNLLLHNCPFQDFLLRAEVKPETYDLIFTNPPYFEDSLKAPDYRKSQARHADSLPYKTIICASLRLLSPAGRLALILPSQEAEKFIVSARLAGLSLKRACKVSSSENKPPKRYLMEFSKGGDSPVIETELIIQEKTGCTREYRELTRDFYIGF